MDVPAGPDQDQRAEDVSNNQHTFPVVFARAGCQIPALALGQPAHLHQVKHVHATAGEGKQGNQASRSPTHPSPPCLTTTPSTRLVEETICCA